MRVHDDLARHVVQIEALGCQPVLHAGRAAVAHHVVVGGHPQQRVLRLVLPLEWRDFVARPLEFLGDHGIVRIQLDAVHELDVGRPSPRRHQPIGGGAAVLVREDDRVPELTPARGRDHFVPHQDRQVGEATDRVRASMKNRRHRGGAIVVVFVFDHDLNVDLGDRRLADAPRAPRRIDLDRQLMVADLVPAQHHAILGVGIAARERQVLGVAAVDEQPQHGRFAARLAPRAPRAPRVDDGDHFGRGGDVERPRGERLRGSVRHTPQIRCDYEQESRHGAKIVTVLL